MYIEHNSYMLAKQVKSAENKRQSNTDWRQSNCSDQYGHSLINFHKILQASETSRD